MALFSAQLEAAQGYFPVTSSPTMMTLSTTLPRQSRRTCSYSGLLSEIDNDALSNVACPSDELRSITSLHYVRGNWNENNRFPASQTQDPLVRPRSGGSVPRIHRTIQSAAPMRFRWLPKCSNMNACLVILPEWIVT